MRAVLVVDADPAVQALVRKICALANLRTCIAADEPTALAIAATESPRAVLCASRLGDRDGIALAAALRRQLPTCFLVVVLAAEDHPRRAEATAAGAEVVLAHPVGAESVLGVIHAILEREHGDRPERGLWRVLVVEPDVQLGAVLARGLGTVFAVSVVSSQERALDEIGRHGEPDAVLAELGVLEAEPAAFGAALEELAPGLGRRVIYMTGGYITESIRAFLETVPNRWLAKPFAIPAVFHALASLVARRFASLPS